METTIIQRIKKLIVANNMSITSLSKKINIVQTTLNRQLNGDTSSIPIGTIEAILHYFPEISAEWLLRGEGEMMKGEDKANGRCDKRKFVVCVDKNGFLKLEE